MIKPLQKLIKAKRTSTKLRILADKVEKYTDFDQNLNDLCVIGYGGRLHGHSGLGNHTRSFSEDYGIPVRVATAILIGDYEYFGLPAIPYEEINASHAATMLRNLADSYARSGN